MPSAPEAASARDTFTRPGQRDAWHPEREGGAEGPGSGANRPVLLHLGFQDPTRGMCSVSTTRLQLKLPDDGAHCCERLALLLFLQLPDARTDPFGTCFSLLLFNKAAIIYRVR